MSLKTKIFLGMTIGSLIGGYVPVVFGAGLLSYSSLFGNTIGALLGIFLTYKFIQ